MTPHKKELIPGLPRSLVLGCLLPRLPWHTRPRMRAVSKAWKEALDHDLAPYAALTRRYCGLRDDLVMVHHAAENVPEWYKSMGRQSLWAPAPYALSIYDDESKRWRLLPAVPAVCHPLRIPGDCGVACVDRKLFVMGGWDPNNMEVGAQVHMLDLGSGAWQWERRSNMRVPKVMFTCLSVARKIYVLGGQSTARVGEVEEQQPPEVYDVDRDHWSLLPPVSTEQGFRANRLVAAGQQVIAVGFNNDTSMAWKVYDPVAMLWSDWDCDHMSGSDYSGGRYEVRDGIVYKLDNSSTQLWTAFDGKVSTKVWEWVGEEIRVMDSSEVEGYLFVNEASKTHVYAIIGYWRDSTLWRGDMDNELKTVAWREVELPGNLYMCGGMCHFH